MIEVKINGNGVDPEIRFNGSDDEVEHLILLWPLLRDDLRQLDLKIKSLAANAPHAHDVIYSN